MAGRVVKSTLAVSKHVGGWACRSCPHLMEEEGWGPPGRGLVHLSWCESKTQSLRSDAQAILPSQEPPLSRHRQNQPGALWPWGHGTEENLCLPCPQGAGGCDLLSCFPDTFSGCLWEVSRSSPTSQGWWGAGGTGVGRSSPLSVNVASILPGSRLWNLLPGLDSESGSLGCVNKSGVWRRNSFSFQPWPGPHPALLSSLDSS